jgi:DNA polymerase III sliding clamp (beta) subunit (PCNA family)
LLNLQRTGYNAFAAGLRLAHVPLSKISDMIAKYILFTSITPRLSKNNQKIKIGLTLDEHQVVFLMDDVELISRLIDGDFPDYQKLIPESYTTKIFVNRDELLQSVKIASVFARESANVVQEEANEIMDIFQAAELYLANVEANMEPTPTETPTAEEKQDEQ